MINNKEFLKKQMELKGQGNNMSKHEYLLNKKILDQAATLA